LTDVQRQGQGFALDPPKAGGLWKPFYYLIVKVQGLGPSRGGALGTWWVQGEALALPNEGSFLTAIGMRALLSGGKHAARKIKRAQILLAADAGIGDEEIARAVSVSGSTVYRTKRRFVEGDLDAALSEEPRPGALRKLSGKQRALLVATACSNPPPGRKRWTLDLLAAEMVRLTDHAAVSRETVRRRLGEDDLKPWRRDMWCLPQIDGAYVARMEDVLDLYAEPVDPNRPVVCFDESPTQLIGETRAPIPAEPGQPERYDCKYRRNGT